MNNYLVSATAMAALALLASPAIAQQHSYSAGNNYEMTADDRQYDGDRDDGYRDEGNRGHGQRHGQGQSRYDDSIVCESRRQGRRYCPVNLRHYEVAVIRQMSDNLCVEGRTWGQDRRGIWVDQGCRAEFGARDTYAQQVRWDDRYDRDQVVRCESRNNERAYCRTDGSRTVRLVSQISNSRCITGLSWGFNRNSIWVDNGCRGDFALVN